VAAKERDLTAHLAYDRHERGLGLVRLLASEAAPDEVAAGTADDLGDFVHGPFEVVDLGPGQLAVELHGAARCADGPLPIRVAKTIRLGGERRSPSLTLDLAIDNGASAPVAVRIGLELPTMLLGGGGNPAAWIEADGGRASHDSTGVATSIATLRQGNDQRGIILEASIEPPADAWWAPIETVSNSEAGFERVYQGSSLLLSWLRVLAAGERFSATLHLAAALDRDLAETDR
jgi:alpha-amylase